ncbi:hypothetical protein ABK040_016694 [Willaertia magna]
MSQNNNKLFLCYGCNGQMNAIYNNEGNLACPLCGSEFVEEIEQQPTTTTNRTTSNRGGLTFEELSSDDETNHPTSYMDITDDDDLLQQALNEHFPTEGSGGRTISIERSSSSSNLSGNNQQQPRVRQSFTVTTFDNQGNRRTFTSNNGFNIFQGLTGATNQQQGTTNNNTNRSGRSSPMGQQNPFGEDPLIQMINQMMGNAERRYRNQGGNTPPPNMFRIGGFGGSSGGDFFTNFLQQMSIPFQPGNGAAFGDYVFGDNLDDIITRLMEQSSGHRGTPPADQETMKKMKVRKATQEDTSITCAVCQDNAKEGDELMELPCGHTYHKDCVTPWLERHANCPVCRADFVNDDKNNGQPNH